MAKSTYLANELLDHVYGNSSYSPPATFYAALCESAPTAASTGSTIDEPDASEYVDYARVAITNNATNFPAASGGAKSNGTAIAFPTAGAGTTGFTGTYLALCDASSGGNVLSYGALASSITVDVGEIPTVPVGDLDLTES